MLIDTILKQARRSQQAEEAQASTELIATGPDPAMIEMRRLLDEQQQLIKHLTRSMHAQQSSVKTSAPAAVSTPKLPELEVPLEVLANAHVEEASPHPVSPPATQEVHIFPFFIQMF